MGRKALANTNTVSQHSQLGLPRVIWISCSCIKCCRFLSSITLSFCNGNPFSLQPLHPAPAPHPPLYADKPDLKFKVLFKVAQLLLLFQHCWQRHNYGRAIKALRARALSLPLSLTRSQTVAEEGAVIRSNASNFL